MSDAAESQADARQLHPNSRYRKLSVVGQFWLALAALASVFVSIYVIFGLAMPSRSTFR